MSLRGHNKIAQLGVVLGAFILARGAAAQTSATKDSEAGKQAAVMSRILEKRLGDELKDQVVTASMFQRGIQGFYVPGVGAMFFVDVKFPVAEPPAPKPAGKAPKREDLWAQFEREVEQGGAPEAALGEADPFALSLDYWQATGRSTREAFDKGKIEQLKTALFDALAQYGGRIEALTDTERIVVVVIGPGGARSPLATRFEAPPTGKGTVGQKKAITKAQEELDKAKAAAEAARRTALATGELFSRERPVIVEQTTPTGESSRRIAYPFRGVRPSELGDHGSVLIISVAHKDLVDDPKELAKRATVEAYCY